MKHLTTHFEEHGQQFEQVYRTQDSATYRQSGMLHGVTLVLDDSAAAFIWKQGKSGSLSGQPKRKALR